MRKDDLNPKDEMYVYTDIKQIRIQTVKPLGDLPIRSEPPDIIIDIIHNIRGFNMGETDLNITEFSERIKCKTLEFGNAKLNGDDISKTQIFLHIRSDDANRMNNITHAILFYHVKTQTVSISR